MYVCKLENYRQLKYILQIEKKYILLTTITLEKDKFCSNFENLLCNENLI